MRRLQRDARNPLDQRPPPATAEATSAPPPATTVAAATERRNRFVLFCGHPRGFTEGSKSQKFAAWSAASTLAYSAIHNHTDVVMVDPARYQNPKGQHWWRIGAIKEYLPHYEWLVWVDADALIMDLSIDLAEFVTPLPSNDTYFVIRRIKIPGTSDDINNGIFMIRNTPLAFEMLDEWARMPKQKASEQRTFGHWSKNYFYDQTDLIMLLNYRKRVSKTHDKSPYKDKFFKGAIVQDCDGLILQAYAGKCQDCDNKPGVRAMFAHWPGDCSTSHVDARTAFCKAFRKEDAVTRRDIQKNPRKGGVSEDELAAMSWAVDQCSNREELDALWKALEGRKW